jgi:hypothetical protein
LFLLQAVFKDLYVRCFLKHFSVGVLHLGFGLGYFVNVPLNQVLTLDASFFELLEVVLHLEALVDIRHMLEG